LSTLFYPILPRKVKSFAHIFCLSYSHPVHFHLFLFLLLLLPLILIFISPLLPSPLKLEPVQTRDFDYHLPPELIAQHPAPERDSSRLLVLNRANGSLVHNRFSDLLALLRDGDVLVLNDSRVFNARLRGANARSGGEFELLLLTQNGINDWWSMVRPGKRARIGTEINLHTPLGEKTGITARVLDTNEEGHRRLQFSGIENILSDLDRLGEVPLPPYIRRNTKDFSSDLDRYQTVYAKTAGSVAAPTAGLHFTENFLQNIRAKNIHVHHVTLHVGLGTFAPVKADRIEDHIMHSEKFSVPKETADAVNLAREQKRRVIAVGTTSVRVLESVAAQHQGKILEGSGETNIFIFPPYNFRIVDALLTNFHLPRSTLLMLVSAFATPNQATGRDQVLRAYAEATKQKYRFYSYGDAMFIL
jgi:S-adenosylmethionine:tRNA ribosyltransferase-isomerase